MTRNEIEYMWKVASNDPNHDTNWNDAVVIAFANLVAQHEREACAQFIETGYARQFENPWRDDLSAAIRARGQA